MKSTNPNSVLGLLNIWGLSTEAEKREIIDQFIQEHGDHYTKFEFAKFLRNKFRAPRLPHNEMLVKS